MINPTVSVLMSIYKEPIDWLRQSIDSIISQTYRNFEFIIICDNPSYIEGISLLKEYQKSDNRIQLMFNETNIGLTKSLNKGLQIAKGKYIARMDADDIALPARFEKQTEFMETHPETIVLGTHLKLFGKRKGIHFNDSVKYDSESIKSQMVFENCIPHSSVFIRKRILDDNNIRYDEEYRSAQDYRLWEQLIHMGNYNILRETLMMYRFSEQQISSQKKMGQRNNSLQVRYRLQKQWLHEYNVDIPIEIISNKPFEVLNIIRNNPKVTSSDEFPYYVQFCYLISPDGPMHLKNFLMSDFRFFTMLNMIRYVIKIIKN